MAVKMSQLPPILLRMTQPRIHLLQRGIWPWTDGVESRLPEHYKLRFVEKYVKKPTPVHTTFEPEYYKDDNDKQVKRRQLMDIPTVPSKQQDEGLWGGEGIIKGKHKRKPRRKPVGQIWIPLLTRRIFYSEILDRYMVITVTHTTLNLIDKALGFDNYILQTHEIDLKSALGMKIKREILSTLREHSLYPNEPHKRKEIYQKYKHFDVVPMEEIEWMGLSLFEAIIKQKEIDKDESTAAIRPLKQTYTEDLIAQMKAFESTELEEAKESSGILKKLFGSDKSDKSDKS